MKLQIKQIYEAPSSDDGKHIFVDRLWARGLTKEKAQLNAREKELAPSTELRKWYDHAPEKFEELMYHTVRGTMKFILMICMMRGSITIITLPSLRQSAEMRLVVLLHFVGKTMFRLKIIANSKFTVKG